MGLVRVLADWRKGFGGWECPFPADTAHSWHGAVTGAAKQRRALRYCEPAWRGPRRSRSFSCTPCLAACSIITIWYLVLQSNLRLAVKHDPQAREDLLSTVSSTATLFPSLCP
jgi:hypothetical protein